MNRWLLLAPALFLFPLLHVTGTAAAGPKSVPPGRASRGRIEKLADGVVLAHGSGFLRLQVRADNIIRVAYSENRAFFGHRSLMVTAPPPLPPPHWHLVQTPETAAVVTARLQARVDLRSGRVSFLDPAGRRITAEIPGEHRLTPALVQGQNTFHVQQQWEPNAGEALYGLGQHQLGVLDLKGYDLDLWQHNTNVVVPFLVSSRGYGILWDNNSFSRFGDLRLLSPVPAALLSGADGKAGGVTVTQYADTAFGRQAAQSTGALPDGAPLPGLGTTDSSVRWAGSIVPTQTGVYTFQGYSNGGIQFFVDGRRVMNHWRQNWLPSSDIARIRLEAGRRYSLRLDWTKDQGADTMRLLWKTPSSNTNTSLWSEVGDGEDYDFVYGPSLDTVVAGYRRLTGAAPLMPRWAYGLWQSRQRYETQQQSLDVVDGFRSRQIPFDNIVQDWFYWPADAWGSHKFDPVRFPDPPGWIDAIHAKHAHLMISVWGKFYPGTANFDAMHSRGFLYQPNLTENLHDWVGYPFTFYDAFNPSARKLFWTQINDALFQKRVDGWWMDASEPDMLALPSLPGTLTHMTPTAGGTPARVLNAWALENSRGIYEGQRAAAPNQRVFILTRSGYAGQQRYATATWSGDITSTWTALQKQIPAGLGFSLSGVPYWTMDIGGFSVPARFARKEARPEDVAEWRELNTRWFEYGAFVPLLRVHGESPFREMWQFGGDDSPTYRAQLKFDRLRYRLLPYLYSAAGTVTRSGGTLMRPLVMDFRTDPAAREITDQYLFGPALLVSPITTYRARSRAVYLPPTPGGWYDFWTGKSLAGGRTITAPAPYDSLPLQVRAGSIIPFGPEQQYVGEKRADPLTVYVYAGASGAFTLYEDDGLTYNYEHGASSRIPFRWNEGAQTLTVGTRSGTFSEMQQNRTFQLVLVTKTKPVGYSAAPAVARTIYYRGHTMQIALKRSGPTQEKSQ